MITCKNFQDRPARMSRRALFAGSAAVVLGLLTSACAATLSTQAAGRTAPPAASTGAASTGTGSAQANGGAATQRDGVTSTQPRPTVSPPPADLAVLSPATVPPADKECSYPVTRTADGNATPLICQDGRLNVQAWRFYAGAFPGSQLLTLGQGATATRVYQAMCHDDTTLHMTYPEAESTEQLAQAYYGWDVSAASLAEQLTDEGCAGS